MRKVRKRWVIAGILAVIVAIVAIGGTVIARVADRHDNHETELRAAFDEARAGVRDEQIDARIDEMVDAGRITAEEGEELKTWYDSRPAVLYDGRFGRRDLGQGFGRGGRSGHHGRSGFGDGDAPRATPEAAPEATPEAS